jgi:outer membrane protein assembly factor BamB
VVAIDQQTGKVVWQLAVGKHNGHDDDGLLAMRGETGKLPKQAEVWPGILGGVIAPMAASKTTLFVPVVNHPLVVSNGVEIGEGEEIGGEMVAIEIATGKEIWSTEYEAPAFGAPVAVNDMVFFATYDGILHGLEGSSGEEVWSQQLPAGSNSGMTAYGNSLIVPAGLPLEEGQTAALVAYSLGG